MKKSHWIQEAIQHPGALRSTLHAKAGQPISHDALVKAAHRPGITGKRARLAMTLKKLHH